MTGGRRAVRRIPISERTSAMRARQLHYKLTLHTCKLAQIGFHSRKPLVKLRLG